MLRDRKTSFIFRQRLSLVARRAPPPRDFSPVGVLPPPSRQRSENSVVGDFEVVRGQASLTAEARRTRLFCSASFNFSRFPASSSSSSSLPYPSAPFPSPIAAMRCTAAVLPPPLPHQHPAGRSVSRLTPGRRTSVLFIL